MSFESNPDRQSRWSRPRWYELLPELLLAAGLMFFLIDDQTRQRALSRATAPSD